jgi:hypothetical protein
VPIFPESPISLPQPPAPAYNSRSPPRRLSFPLLPCSQGLPAPLAPAAASGGGQRHLPKHGKIWCPQCDGASPAVGCLRTAAVLRRPDELLRQSLSSAALLPQRLDEILCEPLHTTALLPWRPVKLLHQPLYESKGMNGASSWSLPRLSTQATRHARAGQWPFFRLLRWSTWHYLVGSNKEKM